MTQEEKAKRYDSMFERLKEMYNNNKTNVAARLICERYFPELKESENKRMIQYFKDLTPFDNADELYEKYGFSHKDAIAWLEKQGEHSNFLSKIQVGDKVTRNEDGVLVNLSQLNRVAKKQGEEKPVDKVETNLLTVERAKEISPFMRSGFENESADKVEPKFHKGDWVVYCNDDVDLITGIEENGYCINNSGYIPFVCASDVRLWTIQDAKDGDVLVSESTCGLGTWYCIFKSLDGDESMTVYCYLTRDGRFETKKELCFDKDPYNTKPATKEQRNTLFVKMKDAGYTFDFDKKELKKIEGTTAWSEEDENLMKWSINNLTELKDRFGEEYGKVGDCINWLKSFRPQTTWKPSGEQMDALRYVTNFDYGGYKATLVSLYEQLKKLRGE